MKTYLVAFSGGKDSIAMVLHLLESGVPKENIHLHHHEVDGGAQNLWDWACTTSYCQAFADALGLQLFFSYREGGIDREMYRQNEGLQDVLFQSQCGGGYERLKSKEGNSTRLKFPAIAADLRTRWCSSCVKIDVLRRVIPAMYKEGEFIICTGERRQESANRAKYNETEPHICTNKKRNVTAWRIVIDWTEEQVWAIIKRWKIQPHPCYMLGYSRCSCQTCIFGSDNIWASNAELSPEKVEAIAQRESDFGFTLYNGMTIFEKCNRGKSFLTYENVARWAAEALGEFVSPIFVENWTLPQGAFATEKAGSV